MNGILCVDKPAGITSFDVVSRLRRITGERKLGHAGTLDPMATGVLPVFAGSATRTISLLPCQDKRYVASFRLGLKSDTGDSTGKILTTVPVTATRGDVERAVASFAGRQAQVPPMYSALKSGGRRLYDLAREGIEVERQAREITVYSIRLIRSESVNNEYAMEVFCSKGTYIRTLCEDIGEKLGCGAIMTALRRTFAAGFDIAECHTLEELAAMSEAGKLGEALLSTVYPFRELPAVFVTERQAVRFCNGGALSLDRLENPPGGGMVRVMRGQGILGLGEVDDGKREIKVKCLLPDSEQ